MSDPADNNVERYNNVTTDDFFLFLDKNSVTANCPMCGNGTAVVSETIKQSIKPPYERVAYVTLFKHVPVIPTEHELNYYYFLRCDKCGFNTTFSAKNVYDWLSEHKNNELKEEQNGG